MRPGELITGPLPQRTLIRVLSYLAIASGVIGSLAILASSAHDGGYNLPVIWGVEVLIVSIGLWMLLFPGQVPSWMLFASPLLATVLTSIAIFATGDAAFALFYLWIVFYIFYFPSSPQQVWAFVIFTSLSIPVALLSPEVALGPSGASVVLFIGTLIVFSVFVAYVRHRVLDLMERLTMASKRDPLTGFLNRSSLIEAIDTEIGRSRPELRSVVIAVIEPDAIAELEPEIAEEYLLGMADLLAARSTPLDSLGREGSSFLILMAERDADQAFVAIERLRESFARRAPSATRGTFSAGIASYPLSARDTTELIAASELSLQTAKARGGDQTVVEYGAAALGLAASAKSFEVRPESLISLLEVLDEHRPGTWSKTVSAARRAGRLAEAFALGEEHAERVRIAGMVAELGELIAEEGADRFRQADLAARLIPGGPNEDLRRWIRCLGGELGDQSPLEVRILAASRTNGSSAYLALEREARKRTASADGPA